MKTLLALAVLAAGAVADGSPEYAVGETFDAADNVADTLIATGDARVFVPVPKGKTIEVRLLLNCSHGAVNQVVSLTAAEAQEVQNAGIGDSSPEAVAYAKTL